MTVRYAFGFDPGFANFGWGALSLDPLRFVAGGVIRTQKATKKAHVLAADDNFVRTQEIVRALVQLIDKYKPVVLVAERMSFPRSASVSAKIALSWGVIATLAEERALPLISPSPQEIKQKCTGLRGASKEEVRGAVNVKLESRLLSAAAAALPNSLHEHLFDALAGVLASVDSDILRAVQRA